MVQLSQSALQEEFDLLFVVNTSGEIEADEVLGRMTDLIDSVQFPTPTAADVPSVSSLSLQGVAAAVNPGTAISGSQTFRFNVSNSDNVQGLLTLTQSNPVATLSTTIDPKATSVAAVVQTVTLAAGETVTFNLSGTATVGAGGAAFSRDLVIRGRQLDEYVFIGVQPTVVLNPPVPGLTDLSYPFSGGRQNVVIPTFSGSNGQHLIISQKASDPLITQILLDGVDQFTAFTRTDDAYTVNGAAYDAYVSDNPLLGAAVSSKIVTLVR